MSQGDDGDRPVTAAELAAVTDALADIQQGMQELRDAQTPAERVDARGDVAEAEAELQGLAKRLNVSPDSLRKAAAEARKADRREELGPVVRELLAEIRQEEADATAEAERVAAEEAEAAAAAAAAAGGPKPKREKAATNGSHADEPVVDTEPVRPHLLDRPIGDLFKR